MEHALDHNLENTPKMSINRAAEFLGVSVQAVHRKLKSRNITCPKIGNKSYITHLIARDLFDIQFQKKTVAFQIVKGGTGKTTCAHNVGSCANAYGARVLMIDIDPQANLTDAFGVKRDDVPVVIDLVDNEDLDPRDSIIPVGQGFDLVPSRIENVVLDNTLVLKKMNIGGVFSYIFGDIAEEYDFVFIDCPPTIGTSVSAATLFSDLVVAPLNPDSFSVKGLAILQKEVANLSKQFRKTVKYKVFLNKFSSNTLLSDRALGTIISDASMEGHTLKSIIRFAQELPNTTSESKSLFSSLKKSSLREDFDGLTREILEIKPPRESSKTSQTVEEASTP